MRDAIGALLDLDLGAEENERFLTALYERWAVDDVDTLSGLGLLVEVDPDARPRTVPAPPPGSVEQLRTLLNEMRAVPKLQFRTIAKASQVDEDTTPELQQSV
jgi:hypothetical protein